MTGARTESSEVPNDAGADPNGRAIAALELGWALQEVAALRRAPPGLPVDTRGFLPDLSNSPTRDSSLRRALARSAVGCAAEDLSNLNLLDDCVSDTLAKTEPPEVLLAYEVGKSLGRSGWQVWLAQASYRAHRSDRKLRQEAQQTWRDLYEWQRMERLRHDLWQLRTVLDGVALQRTLDVLEGWRRAVDQGGWLALGWLGVGGRFTAERASARAALLVESLESCRALLTTAGAADAQPAAGSAIVPALRLRSTVATDPALDAALSGVRPVSQVESAVRWFIGALLAASPVAPVVAGVVSIALYLVSTSAAAAVAPASLHVGIPFTALSATLPLPPIDGTQPLLGGAVILFGAWLVLAGLVVVLGFTSPDRVSMGTYGELVSQLPELEAWANADSPQLASEEETRNYAAGKHQLLEQLAQMRRLQTKPGAPWVLGTGYITLWQRLHRAQEAMIDIESDQAVVSHAQMDILRIRSSRIDNNDTYVQLLAAAVDVLSPTAKATLEDHAQHIAITLGALHAYEAAPTDANRSALVQQVRRSLGSLSQFPPELPISRVVRRLADALHVLSPHDPHSEGRWKAWWPVNRLIRANELSGARHELSAILGALTQPGPAPAATSSAPTYSVVQPSGLRPPRSKAEARGVVRTLRHVLNDFRDDSRAGLLRARNQLAATVGITGITAYTVLWLALAAITLSITPPTGRAGPVEAGLTYYLVGAIVGLFSRLYTEANVETGVDDFGLSFTRLIAAPLLSGVAGILGVIVLAAATAVQVQSAGSAVLPALESAFNLARSPTNIVIAGAFGLTPGLLINRLTQAGEGYKKDLRSTESPRPSATTGS